MAEGIPHDHQDARRLLVITEIDAGQMLRDRDVVRRGVVRLHGLEEDLGLPMAYNRANGHIALGTAQLLDTASRRRPRPARRAR